MTIDRRTFNKLSGLGAVHALSGEVPASAPAARALSRLGISTSACFPRYGEDSAASGGMACADLPPAFGGYHMPDWDERLLASFDAADYVSTIAGAGFQSLT